MGGCFTSPFMGRWRRSRRRGIGFDDRLRLSACGRGVRPIYGNSILPIYGEVARSAGGATPPLTVPRDQVMEKVVALTKRRGFIYPSSEIYGGLSGFYDYGPYGVAMKRAIRDLWWRHMVDLRDDVVGLESTLMMPSAVWEASGHLTNFVDPLRQCLGKCKKRWRADHVLGEKCPECGGPLDDARMFNLMFKTHVG